MTKRRNGIKTNFAKRPVEEVSRRIEQTVRRVELRKRRVDFVERRNELAFRPVELRKPSTTRIEASACRNDESNNETTTRTFCPQSTYIASLKFWVQVNTVLHGLYVCRAPFNFKQVEGLNVIIIPRVFSLLVWLHRVMTRITADRKKFNLLIKMPQSWKFPRILK